MIKKLSNMEMSVREQQLLAKELTSKAKKRVVFRIYPDAWMNYFKIAEVTEREAINRRILVRIRQLEDEYRADRASRGVAAIGSAKLKLQRMDKPYTPEKFGKRMWCICHDLATRIAFIQSIKRLLAEAKLVKERWRLGDFSLPYPLGLFPPRMHRLGNFIAAATL
jgi:hypothetical protein